MTAEKKDCLIGMLDGVAKELLENVNEFAPPTRVDIFKEVSRWVAIKHRINIGENEGIGLDEYRARLAQQSDPARPKREPKPKPDRPVSANSVDGDGGPALDALKARLPSANPPDHDGGFGRYRQRDRGKTSALTIADYGLDISDNDGE